MPFRPQVETTIFDSFLPSSITGNWEQFKHKCLREGLNLLGSLQEWNHLPQHLVPTSDSSRNDVAFSYSDKNLSVLVRFIPKKQNTCWPSELSKTQLVASFFYRKKKRRKIECSEWWFCCLLLVGFSWFSSSKYTISEMKNQLNRFACYASIKLDDTIVQNTEVLNNKNTLWCRTQTYTVCKNVIYMQLKSQKVIKIKTLKVHKKNARVPVQPSSTMINTTSKLEMRPKIEASAWHLLIGDHRVITFLKRRVNLWGLQFINFEKCPKLRL